MALGSSNTLTPDEARDKGSDFLTSVSKGGDPVARSTTRSVAR